MTENCKEEMNERFAASAEMQATFIGILLVNSHATGTPPYAGLEETFMSATWLAMTHGGSRY